MRSSLKPPPPGEEAVFHVLTVLFSGSPCGTGCAALWTRPTTTGLSGSPFKKATSTSCPTRGTVKKPYPAPAQPWLTRIQMELSLP